VTTVKERHDGTGVAVTVDGTIRQVLGLSLPIGVRAWDGSTSGPQDGPVLVLNSPVALRHLLWHPGELGLARGYVSGALDVDGDLREGLRQCWTRLRAGAVRRPALRDWPRLVAAAARLGVVGPPPKAPAEEARLRGRLHAPGRDKAAIAHHYDLGNDFYRLLLDPSMAYSCALWSAEDEELATAQRAKLDRICRLLDLGPGMRLLDVGCGWGSLILHAAEHYGVRATGVTISASQRRFVTDRVAERGLGDLVEVRLRDYREIAASGSDGGYDAVSSIEMGEHVGEANYPVYAATLHRALRPGGRLMLQQMSRGAVAPGGGAFIESYIAPDMTMRPLGRTLAHLEDTGLEVRDVLSMREHYVRTVDAWARTLEERWDDVVAAFGVGTARVWRLYLVGGALAFEENRMSVHQILAVRPGEFGESGMWDRQAGVPA